jgi:hypothetical protein
MDEPDIQQGQWWIFSADVGGYPGTGNVSIQGLETLMIEGNPIEVWNISSTSIFYRTYTYYTKTNFSLVKIVEKRSGNIQKIFPGENYSMVFTNIVSIWPLEQGKNISYLSDVIVKREDREEETFENIEIKLSVSPELVTVNTDIKEYECYEFIQNYGLNLPGRREVYYHYYSPELDWFVRHKVENEDGEVILDAVLKDYKGFKKGSSDEVEDEEKNYDTILISGILVFLIVILSIIPIKYYKFKKEREKKNKR